MHIYEDAVCQRIKRIAAESEHCIQFLYAAPCPYARNMLLYWMKAKMDELRYLTRQDQEDLTLQELARFDGKDGNPAYVAVNGVIYDVTNNAAWAAATHFGLTAGKDLTGEFASCHAGQTILNKLKVVGKRI